MNALDFMISFFACAVIWYVLKATEKKPRI